MNLQAVAIFFGFTCPLTAFSCAALPGGGKKPPKLPHYRAKASMQVASHTRHAATQTRLCNCLDSVTTQ